MTAGAVLGTVFALAASAAWAQPAWKPERAVELMLISGPGSGPDRNARLLQKIWQERRTFDAPVNVINKTGGGGAVAYGYLHQKAGDGHALVLGGATLLSNQILRRGIGHRDLTPVARLTGEYIAIAVRADSPVKTGRDLADLLQKSPESLSIGLATAQGNVNHQAIALALKARGVDLPKVRTVIFQSGANALTALLGGHVDILPASVGILKGPAALGQIRIVAVSSASRLPGEFAGVPTWKEQGIDAVASAWRLAIGARDLGAPQVAFWEGALKAATATEEWKQELAKFHLTDEFLAGAELRAFLDEQHAQLRGLLVDLGLAK